MPGFSDTLETRILNSIFRGAAWPAITGPTKVSMHTADPGDTGASEVATTVWTNYVRANVNTDGATAPFWTAPAANGTAQRVGNSAAVDFGTATISGTAPVITHFGVWDNSATPVFIGGAALASSQTINNGNPVKFNAAGDLTFSLD